MLRLRNWLLVLGLIVPLLPTPSEAAWKFNSYTGKLDYYEASSGGSGSVGVGTSSWNAIYSADGSTVTANSVLRTVGNNIGVGSATPGQTLDVQGTVRASNIGINTTNAVSRLSVGGNTSIGAAYSTIAAPSNGMIVQGNTGLGVSAPVNLLDVNGGMVVGSYAGANTAPSNGMFISGNVGIGTVLSSNNTLTIYNPSSWVFLNAQASGADRAAGILYSPFGTLSASNNQFFTGERYSNQNGFSIWRFNGSSHVNTDFNVNNSGNVGIGTSEPKSLFQVGNPNNFNVLSGGNVGIGSITPGNKLDIQGNARILGSAATFQVGIAIPNYAPTETITVTSADGTNTLGTMRFTRANSSGSGMIMGAASNNFNGSVTDSFGMRDDDGIYFGNAANASLVLRNSNVGIGSANPGTTLDVQGGIRMSGGTVGQAVCFKADKSLGQCTTVVGATGACTCS